MISFSNSLELPQGTIVLVFQPAEEGGGGAKKMIEAGALDKIEAIFGLHNDPLLPVGEVGARSGPLAAGSGRFEAKISGKGGHAAIPQQSIDPILAASNVIVSLQQLISRESDPLDSLVNSPHSCVCELILEKDIEISLHNFSLA